MCAWYDETSDESAREGPSLAQRKSAQFGKELTHRTVAHRKDPGGLRAVHLAELVLDPAYLLVVHVVGVVAVELAEGTAVGRKGRSLVREDRGVALRNVEEGVLRGPAKRSRQP